MICTRCDHEMKEFDSGSELVDEGDDLTPPEYRTTWILWYCDWCDDYEFEYL